MPIVKRCHEFDGIAGCDEGVVDKARRYGTLARNLGEVTKL